MSTKWGLSTLDWRSHAVDEYAYHPIGVYRTQCGHLLTMVTPLHGAPNGKPCEACMALPIVGSDAACTLALPDE